MRKNNGSKNKIIWSILIALLLLIFVFFRGAMRPYESNEQKAALLAEKYAHITKKTNYFEFQREGRSYRTVEGNNKQGEKLYAIISGNNKRINVYAANKGISAKQARALIVSNRKPKKVLNVALGMDSAKKHPVWKVTYLNQKGNLCYSLLTFKNGAVIKEIQNL